MITPTLGTYIKVKRNFLNLKFKLIKTKTIGYKMIIKFKNNYFIMIYRVII